MAASVLQIAAKLGYDFVVVLLHHLQLLLLGLARLLHEDLGLIHNLSFDNVFIEHVLRRRLGNRRYVCQVVYGVGFRLRLVLFRTLLHAADEIERLIHSETGR